MYDLQQSERLPILREKKMKKRSNRKLLFVLLLFFTIVLVVLFFNSPFSKITSIEIEGIQYVTDLEVGQALGVNIEDQFFAVNSKVLADRVKQLATVEAVSVKKSFPGRIQVFITEYNEVAYAIDASGVQSVILANGVEMPIMNEQLTFNKPLLTGWDSNDPIKIQLSEVLATIPPILLDDISEIKPIPSASYPDRIKLYTRSFFEVITAVEYLAHKLSYLDEVIDELHSRDIYDGVLTMLLADTHAPFAEIMDEEDAEIEELEID